MELMVIKKRVFIEMSNGGHQLVKLEKVGEKSHEESIHYVEKEKIINKKVL